MAKVITYCKVEDCETRCHGNGYCWKHYLQIRRHGNLVSSTSDPRPAIIEGRVAKIPLGLGAHNGYTTVDADDSWVSKYQWYLSSNGYSMTHVDGKHILLHKLLVDRGNTYYIDHKNRNKLDNQRDNLRICTQSDNMMNRLLGSNNTSGYKGVYFATRERKYIAEIVAKGKKYRLGTFITAEDAALAYNVAAERIHGEFALPNNVIGVH